VNAVGPVTMAQLMTAVRRECRDLGGSAPSTDFGRCHSLRT